MEIAYAKSATQVGIIGCGWLGYPLGLRLLEEGFDVMGTTTTGSKIPLMEEQGIKGHLLDLNADLSLGPLLETSVWILAFPPKTKSTNGDWYVQAVARIVDMAKLCQVKRLILLSSTSVYPDTSGTMHEELEISEANTGNLAIWKAEQLVLQSGVFQTYVLRLGGLAGEGRALAKHFAGKSDLANGDSPVNFLHRTDAVNSILFFLLHLEERSGVYNVCSPIHPSRKEVFTSDCIRMGLAAPHFLKGGMQRIISVSKVIESGFLFSYPDPMNFFYG